MLPIVSRSYGKGLSHFLKKNKLHTTNNGVTQPMSEHHKTTPLSEHWIIKDFEARIDAIERRVALGKYAPLGHEIGEAQKFHGERVEHRQKKNS